MVRLIALGLAALGVGIAIGVYWSGQGGAGGIGPDSALYILDGAGEWIELNVLAWDGAAKLEVRLRLMQERLDELSDLERLKKLSQESAERVKERYTKLAQEAINDLERKAQEAVDARTKALLEKTKNIVKEQQQSLAVLLEEAPESVKSNVKSIKDVLQNAFERAVNLISKEE